VPHADALPLEYGDPLAEDDPVDGEPDGVDPPPRDGAGVPHADALPLEYGDPPVDDEPAEDELAPEPEPDAPLEVFLVYGDPDEEPVAPEGAAGLPHDEALPHPEPDPLVLPDCVAMIVS